MELKLSPLTAITLSYLCTLVTGACYFPDGTLATNNTPCRDDTDNSLCCGQGYACLSNGLCQATGKELQKPGASEFVRGSCTDKDYRSSACPGFCNDPELDHVSGGMGVAKCEDTDEDLYFCINQDAVDGNVDCENGENVLFFPGTPTAYTTIGVAATSSVESSTTESATSTAEDETTTTSAPDPAGTTGSAESSQPSETDDPDPDKSDNKGAIIGGAVGGVVGVAILGVLGWWLLRRRRSKKDLAAGEAQMSSHPMMHAQDGQLYFKDQPEGQNYIHEMPNDTSVAELPGSGYR